MRRRSASLPNPLLLLGGLGFLGWVLLSDSEQSPGAQPAPQDVEVRPRWAPSPEANPPGAAPVVRGERIPPPRRRQAGLTKDELGLSAQTLTTAIRVSGAAAQKSVGSTGVFQVRNDVLNLVTNAHCLGLERLGKPSRRGPRIIKYELEVQFPGGLKRVVSRVGVPVGDRDIAVLEVESVGLEVGRHYVVLPSRAGIQIATGDEVVAIGSPLGLQNTTSFGRISAIRTDGVKGMSGSFIQLDVTIAPGSSGGPLLLARNSEYQWIGVNTFVMRDASGIGFAIKTDEVLSAQFIMYDANPSGVAQLLRERFDVTGARAVPR